MRRTKLRMGIGFAVTSVCGGRMNIQYMEIILGNKRRKKVVMKRGKRLKKAVARYEKTAKKAVDIKGDNSKK